MFKVHIYLPYISNVYGRHLFNKQYAATLFTNSVTNFLNQLLAESILLVLWARAYIQICIFINVAIMFKESM